jgi:hypothetical protein
MSTPAPRAPKSPLPPAPPLLASLSRTQLDKLAQGARISIALPVPGGWPGPGSSQQSAAFEFACDAFARPAEASPQLGPLARWIVAARPEWVTVSVPVNEASAVVDLVHQLGPIVGPGKRGRGLTVQIRVILVELHQNTEDDQPPKRTVWPQRISVDGGHHWIPAAPAPRLTVTTSRPTASESDSNTLPHRSVAELLHVVPAVIRKWADRLRLGTEVGDDLHLTPQEVAKIRAALSSHNGG